LPTPVDFERPIHHKPESVLKKKNNAFLMKKEISIFRTSLANTNDIAMVRTILDFLVGKNEWNFDLEDVDNILRIHANTFVNGFLTQELRKMGFECEELF